MALRGVLEYGRNMFAHRTAAMVQLELRKKLYAKVVELGTGAISGLQRTGDVILSLVDGVEQLETYFGQYLPQLFVAVLTPIGIFCFIAFLDLPVAAVLTAFALITFVAPALFHKWDSAKQPGALKGLQDFRVGNPGFHSGPWNIEILWPERRAHEDAGGKGACSVPQHLTGAGHEFAVARHHRHGHRGWSRRPR